MKIIIVEVIRLYKAYISPIIRPNYRFYPSCSSYFCQAVEKKGLIKGIVMGFWRIIRCNQLSKGGYDPVI